MNCVHCEERLSDYLEGSLSQAERNAVELHLQACGDCKQLLTDMSEVLQWGRSFPVYAAPADLQARIIANVPIMDCAQSEEFMSDYLEGALDHANRRGMDLHLESCVTCSALRARMAEVIQWGRTFPVHEAPAWLPTRIIANTPRIERESWFDTLAVLWKWILDPRSAIGVFTATLVLSWLGNLAGISPDWTTVVRNPSAIYYEAQGAVNRAYDEAVRRYYRSPLVTGIRTRIEQLREIS